MAVIFAVNTAGWAGNNWLTDAQPVQAAESVAALTEPRAELVASLPTIAGEMTPAVADARTAPNELGPANVPAAAPRESLPPATSGSEPPAALIWQGVAGQDGHIRSAPTTTAPKVGDLRQGQPIRVLRWVGGQEVETENTTWADLGDGRYVYSALLRSRQIDEAPARPADAPTSGRWIDVNLTLQVATAYEGTTPVKSILISTGRPGWETPRGTFKIQRRVAKETMDGRTLVGQGPNGAGATYKVENVRWTQYFTADGSAIHENYWRNSALFGMPGSHGCIGMRSADANWFWDFATQGTPIVIH